MNIRRLLVIATASVTGVLAVSGASANREVQPAFAVSTPGDGTYVYGNSANETVSLDYDRAEQRYLISDTAGITPNDNCTAVSAREVSCLRFGIGGERDIFAARLGPGDDQFSLVMHDR